MQRNLWRFIKQEHSVLHKKDSSGATREKRVFWEVLFAIVQNVRQKPSGGAGSVVRPAPSKINVLKGTFNVVQNQVYFVQNWLG